MRSASSTFALRKREWTGLLAIVIAMILVRLWINRNGPYNYDEYNQVVRQSEIPIEDIRNNHLFARIFSTAVVRSWGMDMALARIPSYLTSLFFLVLMPWILLRSVAPAVVLLVFASFVFNEAALWHFHSVRGYTGLLLGTALNFSLLLDFTRRREVELSGQRMALMFGVFAFTVFCHSITFLFHFLLLLALLGWGFTNSAYLTTGDRRFFRFLGLCTLVALPFVLWGVIRQWTALVANRFIGRESAIGLLDLLGAFFGNVGFLRSVWSRLFFVLFVALVGAKAYREGWKSIFGDFGLTFNVLFGISVVAIFPMLGMYDFQDRFLFPFLFPFLISIFELALEVTPGVRRAVAVCALGFFVYLVPAWEGPMVAESYTLGFDKFHQFSIGAARAIHREREGCYECRGSGFLCKIFAKLYYRAEQTQSADCKVHFLLEVNDGNQLRLSRAR